jgi:hypothetical protein
VSYGNASLSWAPSMSDFCRLGGPQVATSEARPRGTGTSSSRSPAERGFEHLASEYRRRNPPVIPLDYALGSSTKDTAGGGIRLTRLAVSDPARFFELRGQATALGEQRNEVTIAAG